MINKYVCYIDVDQTTGEVNIEGLEYAPTVDYIRIGSELIYQYEKLVREFVSEYKKIEYVDGFIKNV